VGWDSWVGPGQRDRLAIKCQHLLSHQLPLSARPEAQATLRRLGVSAIDRCRVLLLGVLFTPWGAAEATAVGAARPAQGRWLRPSQLDGLFRQRPNSRWAQRFKPMWFGPWETPFDDSVSSDRFGEQIRTVVPTRPQLWVRMSSLQHPGPEVFFLVPESWGQSHSTRTD
jgi:hypothetical protein